MSPEKAGQLASMLPQLIPTVLGAAGGLVGGALSMVGKVPETVMQAGSQLAGTASQSLGSLMKQGLDSGELEKASPPLDTGPGTGRGSGAGGGAGGTLPAGGGAVSTPPAVTPTTGPPPHLPSVPTGALPQPVSPAVGSSGVMPMGMPLGGLAGAHPGGGGQEAPQRPKKVVVPPEPHTESVTGKVHADRIALSLAGRDGPEPEPPDDGSSPRPVVRRITMASRDDARTEFEDFGDAEKVKFVEADLTATLDKLDDMIARLTALRTEVEDPDGLVRFSLGDDGRLLSLFIDDAVRTRLTNLGLEKKLNDLLSAGNEAMRLSRRQFWDGVGEGPGERGN
jgi:hypothetical protein